MDKMLAYQIRDGGANVAFIFNEDCHQQAAVGSVHVVGTFNQWTVAPAWQLAPTGQGIWSLTVPAAKACIPGNSGYPEFKFIVNENSMVDPLPTIPPGYSFKGNNLLLFTGTDLDQIVANETTANTVKRLADFDLTREEDQKTIANFRLVPGTTNLFRSYHPACESKPLDAEVGRLVYVNQLVAAHGIQSIISLSGAYEEPPTYRISPYVQKIIAAGHFFAINPNYESVYYQADTTEFGHQLKSIIEFIIDPAHPAPFLVHCRIGTDRTGVISAMIAGLCGASWENIGRDYQKSNAVGMEEYRDIKLLQFAFENMLKKKIDPAIDLKTVLSTYFVRKGYLQPPQIEALWQKLNAQSGSASGLATNGGQKTTSN
ncbi:MAG: hypothetical protein GX050_05230 [Firmicutes bacterium]|nr:hypothetical protein [Bacillota bacterium]